MPTHLKRVSGLNLNPRATLKPLPKAAPPKPPTHTYDTRQLGFIEGEFNGQFASQRMVNAFVEAMEGPKVESERGKRFSAHDFANRMKPFVDRGMDLDAAFKAATNVPFAPFKAEILARLKARHTSPIALFDRMSPDALLRQRAEAFLNPPSATLTLSSLSATQLWAATPLPVADRQRQLTRKLRKAEVRLFPKRPPGPRPERYPQRAVTALANIGTKDRLVAAGLSAASAAAVIAARTASGTFSDVADVSQRAGVPANQLATVQSAVDASGNTSAAAQVGAASDLAFGVLSQLGVSTPTITIVQGTNDAYSTPQGIVLGTNVIGSISVEGLAEIIAHEAGHIDDSDSPDMTAVNGLVQVGLISQDVANAFSQVQETLADVYAGIVAGVIDPDPSNTALGQWLVVNAPDTDAPSDHPLSADRDDALADTALNVSSTLAADQASEDAAADGVGDGADDAGDEGDGGDGGDGGGDGGGGD